MKRTDELYISDIIESIEIVIEYLNDVSEFEFLKSVIMRDAVARRFEIIGEAASHVSDNLKERYPQIEWRLMKDMRNLLIHEYFGVDYPTLYMTVQSNLPSELENLDK